MRRRLLAVVALGVAFAGEASAAPKENVLRAAPPARDKPSASANTSAPRVRGHELLSLQVGPELGARHFQYTDGLTSNLRSYDLGAAPLVAASAGVYPFADLASAIDVGLIGGYARAVALSSAPAGGDAVTTDWWRFHAGVRGRARIGASFVLGISAVYGGETFGFSESALDAQVPAVAYRFIRPRVDARAAFGRFAVAGSVGYDIMLSAGRVADRFPHASVGGVESSLGPTFSLTRAWEVSLTASYRRFFYAMHPVPGDAFVAGGALDEMLGLQGGLAYVF